MAPLNWSPLNWSPQGWSPQRVLDPTPAEARDWLDRELQGADYRESWLDSALRWIVDHLLSGEGLGVSTAVSLVTTVLVALVVIALLAWVLPKVRRESRAAHSDGAVLEDLTISARTYRDRTAQALRDGRYDDAVLDGFRAIAKDMSDRTLLNDAPGSTAHEASVALAPCFPDHADRLAQAADLFDAVRYGHRRASADQAGQVQRLDAELVTTRPVLAASRLLSV
jgi:Domain of unknown function (DUF4129)